MSVEDFVGVAEPGRFPCRALATRYLAAHGIPVPQVHVPADAADWMRVAAPMALDVVVFNVAGQPDHMGVCLGAGRFLHVQRGKTSRIERLTSPEWRGRIEGFYRYTRTV